MNRKTRLMLIFYVVVLAIPIFGVRTAKASPTPIEWTQNSTFVKSGYQWDLILYDWRWEADLFGVFLSTGETAEVFPPYWGDLNYALWPSDGVVTLAAKDPNDLENWGRSSRVTYGPFHGEYPDVVPPPLPMNGIDELTLRGAVSNYGSSNVLGPFAWTGIKFDAWFMDPLDNDRKMVIEMYFHGTGNQGWWGNEFKRTWSDGTHDNVIKLQAFPEYATMTGDIPQSAFGAFNIFSYSHTEFEIDLKGIWQRAADHWGRSSADLLYAVALDVESGTFLSPDSTAWATLNELKVTYTDTTPPTNPTSWSSSSHALQTWSNDNTIDVSWSGASDDLSGVAGYSIDWTTSSTTIPDTTMDTTETSATSPALASDNNWYFHIRTKDNAGNWATNAFHVGPFYIDLPPATPSTPSGSTTVYRNVWYTYSTNTTDPDGDDVRYEFEFSGPIPTVSFTSGWYASGETVSITVMWEPSDPIGTYYVRARAQDVYEWWSDLSSSLEVSLIECPHDVAATSIAITNASRIGPLTMTTITNETIPLLLDIDAGIENQGTVSETFDVSIYYRFAGQDELLTLETVTLTAGSSTVVTAVLNTSDLVINVGNETHPHFIRPVGYLTIVVEASQVANETDTSDNTIIAQLLIKMPGDVDGDGDSDMFDFGIFAQAYATSLGQLRYDVECDFDRDSDVDYFDYNALARYYQESVTYPPL